MTKKNFKFEVWIHPKHGGDDECVEVDVTAISLDGAKHFLEKWLAKRSEVTNDYHLLEA